MSSKAFIIVCIALWVALTCAHSPDYEFELMDRLQAVSEAESARCVPDRVDFTRQFIGALIRSLAPSLVSKCVVEALDPKLICENKSSSELEHSKLVSERVRKMAESLSFAQLLHCRCEQAHANATDLPCKETCDAPHVRRLISVYDFARSHRLHFLRKRDLSTVFVLKELSVLQMSVAMTLATLSGVNDRTVTVESVRNEAADFVSGAIEQIDYSAQHIETAHSHISIIEYRQRAMAYMRPWLDLWVRVHTNDPATTFQAHLDHYLRRVKHTSKVTLRSLLRDDDPWLSCSSSGIDASCQWAASRSDADNLSIYNYDASANASTLSVLRRSSKSLDIRVGDKVRLVSSRSPLQVAVKLDAIRISPTRRIYQKRFVLERISETKDSRLVVCSAWDWFGNSKPTGSVIYERDQIQLCTAFKRGGSLRFLIFTHG